METTIMPFASLPSCATECGVLFDANGACAPPTFPQVNNDCFCNFGALQPWKAGPTGVCDYVSCNSADSSSIQAWYTNYCATATGGNAGQPQPTASNNDPAQTSDDSSPSGTSRPASQNNGPGGDWISNHWRWVIGLVILVVGIAGIWIGACIWRRRYLKRRERQRGFGKHTSQSAFPAAAGSDVHAGGPGATADPSAPGVFMPNAPGVDEEKKRWHVRDRT